MAQETAKQRWFLRIICLVAAIAGLLFGYDTGVISGAILFIKQEFRTTIIQQELIISMVSLGAIVGAIFGGPIADKFGRKKTVLFSAIIFVISAIGLAWSPTVNWLITGRLVVGFAIGVSSATVPIYIAELAPRNMRGALVTFNQLFITIGILLAYIAGLALAKSQGWRTMFLLAAIPAIIQFFIMLFFPRSPRWLIKNGFDEEARQILLKFRGSEEDVNLEIAHIEKAAKEPLIGWHELFNRKFFPAVIAGVGLTVIQQITGINTIIYYAPTIFQLAGFASDKAALLATTIVGIVNVLMTFVAIWLLDRVGRKPLLIVGICGMIASLFVLGLGFYFPERGDTSNVAAWASVISMVCYVAFFAFSLGPNGWLINSEIYPLKARGRAMGLATCSNWAANFIVTVSFLNLIHAAGKSGTFWIFGLIGILGLIFIIFKIPETKGKSLEEIEDYWRAR